MFGAQTNKNNYHFLCFVFSLNTSLQQDLHIKGQKRIIGPCTPE